MFKYLRKILVFSFVFFLIYSLTQSIFEYQKRIKFSQDYKNELEAENEKKIKLKSQILKRQDYYTVEKDIREKLNLLKPDEVAILLPKITPSPTPTPEVKKPPLVQWWELFVY